MKIAKVLLGLPEMQRLIDGLTVVIRTPEGEVHLRLSQMAINNLKSKGNMDQMLKDLLGL